MKKLFSVFMVLAVILTVNSCPVQVFATDNDSPYVCEASLSDDFEEDCLLITIKDSYSQINKVWTAQQLGLTNVAEIEDLTAVSANDTNTFNTTDGFEQMLKIHLSSIGKQNVLDMMNQASESPYISIISPSFIYENVFEDEYDEVSASSILGSIYDYPITSEYTPTSAWNDAKHELYDIGAIDAWEEYGTGSATIKVAIMDTGVAEHFDLDANVIDGWDFANDNAITTDDLKGHGTAIAGLIGAVGGNNKGYTGINWNVSIVPIQISKNGIAASDLADAFLYSQRNGIHIVNCSFGFVKATNETLFDQQREKIAIVGSAMEEYEGLIVCAAGNENSFLSTGPQDAYQFPAMYDLDNIICVGATCKGLDSNNDVFERKAIYSNYGSEYVDIFAPGGAGRDDIENAANYNVLTSTLPLISTDTRYGTDYNTDYKAVNGTSYAAPVVAGAAALILSHNPNLSGVELKHILMNSVDTHQTNSSLQDFSNLCVSGGRLNVYRALQNVLEGNSVRTVATEMFTTSTVNLSDAQFTLTYDIGKYELSNIALDTIEGVTMTADTSVDGQITIQCSSDSDVMHLGRLAYIKFRTRLSLPVAENEMLVLDSLNSYASRSALMGDIDGDNDIDTADVRACFAFVNNSENATELQRLAADCNSDGVITSADQQLLLSAINSGTTAF